MKHTITLALLLSMTVTAHASDNCRPPINDTQQNYIIGYGSLMQSQSRQRTTPNATHAYPIEVRGFKRVWGFHGGHYPVTFLTLLRAPKQRLDGVYYAEDSDQIEATDNRERSYCRIEVPHNHLKPLGLSSLPAGHYWIYAQPTNHVEKPSKSYPLVQSYVDIFLEGCLQMQTTYQLPDFANQCIKQTHGWPSAVDNADWINDRVHARRPFDSPYAVTIDRLLSAHFDHYFDHPIE